MSKDTAIAEVMALLEGVAPLPSYEVLGLLLDQSVLPDAAGVMPATDGWIPTYDTSWAVALVADRLALTAASQGTVTQVTSEGTTVQMTPPDWASVAIYWRSRSRIGAALGLGNPLGFIDVDRGTPYTPTSDGLRP
jgi:hypothetical protein